MEIQHFSHHHSLALRDGEENNQVNCFGCKLTISGPSYHCNQCCFDIHKSCSELPREIKHSFHSQHPLTLLAEPPYSSRSFVCNACGKTHKGFTFNCSECQFDLDINCAALKPTQNHQIFENRSHPHPLIICEKDNNLVVSCSGCDLPINDSIWVCLECNLLLHKSCAELPNQIKHQFHPLHPLTLHRWPPTDLRSGGTYLCNACLRFSSGLTYHCTSCNFKIDVSCASPMPTIKSEHQHPLALVNMTTSDFICNVCCSSFQVPFLRCVDCNFNLHVHCNPILPHTLKHKCHLHPLNLTYSLIKDHPDEDEDAELYCDACEELRNLVDPTYFCAECRYVAHITCVGSEVLRILVEEWSAVELVKEIAELGAELKEQTTELEELKTSLKVKTAKVEALNKKLEALEKKRAQHNAIAISDLGKSTLNEK